jgi:hypothetical protein
VRFRAAILVTVALGQLAGCAAIANLDQFDNAVAAGDSGGDDDGTSPDARKPPNGPTSDARSDVVVDATFESSGKPSVDTGLDASVDATVEGAVDAPADSSVESSLDSTIESDSVSPTDSVASESTPRPDSMADDGSSDSPNDTSVPDTRSPPSIDSSADVVEAQTTDVSVPSDATDASPPANTWCLLHASALVFDCHDFDEGKSVAAGFTSRSNSGDYVSITSTDYAPGSSPSSMLVSTPALDGGSAYDQLNDILPYHRKLELSFAVKIVHLDPSSGMLSLFRVSYQNGDWSEMLMIKSNGTALYEWWPLADGGTGSSLHTVTAIPLGSWVLVDLVVDLDAHTQSFSYDGASALATATISNRSETNPALEVQTGLNQVIGPSSAVTVDWDDIVVSTP